MVITQINYPLLRFPSATGRSLRGKLKEALKVETEHNGSKVWSPVTGVGIFHV